MQFSLSTATAVFKDTFGKRSENVYNSKNVTLARLKKSYGFTGKSKILDTPLSFAGGVGSGSLPIAGVGLDVNPTITAKKVYGVCEIDREAIKAADGDKGSFVSQTKHSVKQTVESYMRNLSRIIWNELDNGQLGTGDGSTAVTGDGSEGTPYLVIISSTSWKEANWEEQDYVNVGSETTTLRVKEVVPTTRQVKLVGTSATLAAAVAGATATSAKIYMQGSKDNDPVSIPQVLAATSGSLYGVTVQRRYMASLQKDSSSAGISTDFLNEDTLEIERKTGQPVTMIRTSYVQYRKILNLLEDKKEYIVEPRAENLKGKVSFRGVEFMSSSGPIPILPERFIKDDRIYYMNDDMLEMHHRPGFGWFDDDGTVFLRKANSDAYEARYGGYMQLYVEPYFHGYRYGLAT